MSETSVTDPSGDGTPSSTGRPPTSDTDGRASRGARTRAAVVDALLALNEEGNLRPTAREIAARAGVSLRSVYVHFDDVESLFVASAVRYRERLAALAPPVEYTGDLAARLAQFLRRRRLIGEEGAQVRRAAVLQEPFSPALQRALGKGRRALRAEVAAAFAPEIAAAPAAQRDRLLRALDLAASTATWDVLRAQHGLPADEAEAQMRDMLLAVLAGWGPATSAGGSW